MTRRIGGGEDAGAWPIDHFDSDVGERPERRVIHLSNHRHRTGCGRAELESPEPAISNRRFQATPVLPAPAPSPSVGGGSR